MITVWRALRANLVFFVLGAILGACLVTVAIPTPNDELQRIELETTRNTEKIADINRQLQVIFDWISDADRQRVHDAEILGGIRITVANHDKLVWLAFVNLIAITSLLARQVVIDRKKKG